MPCALRRRDRSSVARHVELHLLLVAIVTSATGCTAIANGIANGILSNLESPNTSDKEWPPTAIPIAPSADTTSILGGNGDGLSCSIPSPVAWLFFSRRENAQHRDVLAPISLQMRQACVSHDYCYRHGNATYGYTQADCDYRLQEHGYRLCRQIYGGDDFRACETDAKKVLLGVWLFGAKVFHRASPENGRPRSTYFEYDPMPDARRHFAVGRIASRESAPDDCGMRSALYVFDVRPSGTIATEVEWHRNAAGECAPSTQRVELPGDPELLATAPEIVRDGTGADWFVWWRRSAPSNTWTGILAISPSKVPLAEWRAQFSSADHGSTPGVLWRDIDPLIVSGQPLPNESGTDGIVLGGLSTQLKPAGSLSWVDVALPPSGSMPATAHTLVGDAGVRSDLYRNFAAPVSPFYDLGTQQWQLVWTSRGEGVAGDDYAEIAYLHRTAGRPLETLDADNAAADRPARGDDVPVVSKKVDQLSEKREPLAVIVSPTRGPTLLSLSAAPPDLPTRSMLVAREAPLLGGEAEVELAQVGFPAELDTSWMSRPPVVLPPAHDEGGSRILFSRLVDTPCSEGASVICPAIEVGLTERARDGWVLHPVSHCTILRAHRTGASRASVGSVASCVDEPAAAHRPLAATQTIVADMNGDALPDVTVVDARCPSASIVMFGADRNGRYELDEDRRYVQNAEISCGSGRAREPVRP